MDHFGRQLRNQHPQLSSGAILKIQIAPLPSITGGENQKLRNCCSHRARWNALQTAGINGRYLVAIGGATYHRTIHIIDRRVRRGVYTRKGSTAGRPIDVVPRHGIGRTGRCIPTYIDLMCDRCTCTRQRDCCSTSAGRVATDRKLSSQGSGCGWLEL
jgi:hypothetical protein